jgi:hypothetical protein
MKFARPGPLRQTKSAPKVSPPAMSAHRTAQSTSAACLVCLASCRSFEQRREKLTGELEVSLEELIAQTNMDHQSVVRLREEIVKFTQWLGRNAEKYFVKEYHTPSSEYIEKSKF